MTALTVNTKGTSTITHTAEIAAVALTISSTGADRTQVSRTVVDSSTKLQSTLKEYATKNADGTAAPGAPITHYHMTALSTSSHQSWINPPNNADGPAEERTEYTASTSFDIKFVDFGLLGTVVTQLTDQPLVSIHGITWTLTDAKKSALQSNTRKLAVQDAVTKATEFASAVGKAKVVPVEINADGLTGSRGSPGKWASMEGYGTAAVQYALRSGSGSANLSLEPEEVEVSCTVSVVFEAE